MYLKNLSLVNFKNYEEAGIHFSEKINCLVGDNGVGKTNILDAIHYLSLCKSYFNPIDSQNIKKEEDFFIIQGEFEKGEETDKVYCGIKKGKKKVFKRNSKEYQKLAEHIGLFPVVMISPADSSLIAEGSEERRKFMNGVISQYDKEYLDDVINYNKALKQRNALLKDFSKRVRYDKESLDIWTEQLILLGKRIYQKRSELIEQLVPIFQHYYAFIADNKETVKLTYSSHFEQDDHRLLFEGAIDKDRVLQYSTVGIHKDDLELDLENYPIKKIGSQGQQKTYLVALKLAKFDFMKKKTGYRPLLLLDDVFDKFDHSRVQQIIKLVAEENFGQIFITDTNKTHLQEILLQLSTEYKIFEIDNGKISNSETQ